MEPRTQAGRFGGGSDAAHSTTHLRYLAVAGGREHLGRGGRAGNERGGHPIDLRPSCAGRVAQSSGGVLMSPEAKKIYEIALQHENRFLFIRTDEGNKRICGE